MLVRNELVLAKLETTYNTDSTPTGALDAIQVSNIGWSNSNLRMIDREILTSNIGKLKQIYAGATMDLTFDVELKGSGTAGTAPEVGPLLEACGYGLTTVLNTSNTYTPASTGHKSLSMYFFQDGLRYVLTGCRGNVSFSFEAGNVSKASFTFTGHTAGAPTAVTTPTASFDTTIPVPLIGQTFSVGGYGAVINSLSFDSGNTIAVGASLTATDGFAEVRVTGRDVNGSFDPEAVLETVHAFHGALRAGTTFALSGVFGATAGNVLTIAMPAVAYRDVSPGDRDGIRTYDVPFGAAQVSGDDEVSLAFT